MASLEGRTRGRAGKTIGPEGTARASRRGRRCGCRLALAGDDSGLDAVIDPLRDDVLADELVLAAIGAAGDDRPGAGLADAVEHAELGLGQRQGVCRGIETRRRRPGGVGALAEADLALARAQRRDIELRISRTEIKAKVGGTISRRNARLGALAAAAGEPLFRVIAESEVELEADVPEATLARMRPGQRADRLLLAADVQAQGDAPATVGASKVSQVEDNIAALDIVLCKKSTDFGADSYPDWF